MTATTRPVFGSLPRVPKPVLLLIVYGMFLVVVGVTAMAQTILVSVDFSNAALTQVVGSDAGTVRSFVNLNLLESDLGGQASPTRREALATGLKSLIQNGNLLHVEVRLPDGTIVASEDPALYGRRMPSSPDYQVALSGKVAPNVVQDGAPVEAAAALAPPALIREYLPVSSNGSVRAIVGVWRDAEPVLTALDGVRREVVFVTVSGALIAAVFLFFVFRAAQARITRQTKQLVDATRRDPLTDLLNHGALVTTLADRIETARNFNETIGIVLVDVDGFRLLNDTYGHDAGDFALREVAQRLRKELDQSTVIGRYGPDEFLVIVDSVGVVSLEPAVERLRTSLATAALEFDASERLPLTVSAGICVYPVDAESVTDLLATAVQTLTEAKASGGDAIRVAGRLPVASADARTFDVFQGLILAVDAKDRYTKRHSEDVARYAQYLARKMGVDDETVRTVRVAGLLHDVGKIGIPDVILRKPGKLTDDEFNVVKQHVALGDMIVRDLPNVDVIRTGVRHHHERWDGRGYLHALAGEDIPLVARILAVGDAFSAMTTTRPYRKALSVDEALRRLEDAAGTQLDERLVAAFVAGIRSDVDAPLPGVPNTTPARIWTPADQVA
ncbi:MAG TPA: HD domain-containing phosphohydrolase [Candidatus Limnocylindrales bacterium]|nr:HD domain-containing phosphohydrolase [Candidatus Limnocylindrales bacterium]